MRVSQKQYSKLSTKFERLQVWSTQSIHNKYFGPPRYLCRTKVLIHILNRQRHFIKELDTKLKLISLVVSIIRIPQTIQSETKLCQLKGILLSLKLHFLKVIVNIHSFVNLKYHVILKNLVLIGWSFDQCY